MQQCPKCGRPQDDARVDCIGCGIVFAKYDPDAALRVARQRVASREDRRTGARHTALVLVGLAVLAAVAVAWSMRPMPHRLSPVPPPAIGAHPVFEGTARDYAGPRGDLVLMDAMFATRTKVGTIEPGGKFRFQLPKDPGTSAAVEAERRRVRDWNLPGPGVSDAYRAHIADRLAHAPHRFNVEYWTSLDVQPIEATIVQYQVVVEAPGMPTVPLILTSSPVDWFAEPGDVMALFAWSDRRARVEGRAPYDSPLADDTGLNTWRLALSPGWNVISSIQTGRGAELRYETAELPRDLEWWAKIPRSVKL